MRRKPSRRKGDLNRKVYIARFNNRWAFRLFFNILGYDDLTAADLVSVAWMDWMDWMEPPRHTAKELRCMTKTYIVGSRRAKPRHWQWGTLHDLLEVTSASKETLKPKQPSVKVTAKCKDDHDEVLKWDDVKICVQEARGNHVIRPDTVWEKPELIEWGRKYNVCRICCRQSNSYYTTYSIHMLKIIFNI